MFGLSGFRLGVYAAIAALLVYIVWHDHYVTKKLNATRLELRQAETIIENERELRATEQADRRRADATAKSTEAELARVRAEPRITRVRICPTAGTVSAARRAAASAEGASAGRVEGTAAQDSEPIDVSDAVDAYATDCAAVGVIAKMWQEWDAARTH